MTISNPRQSAQRSGPLPSAAFLSPAQERFQHYLAENPRGFDRASFTLARAASFIDYPLQPWPIFLDAARSRELQDVASGLSSLLRTAPERIFRRDPRRLAQFYRLSAARAAGLVEVLGRTSSSDLITRADLILGPEGWRCLEINATTNLGGFEEAFFASDYLDLPVVADFLAAAGWRAHYHDPVAGLFDHLLRLAGRLDKIENQRLDTALVLPARRLLATTHEREMAAAYQRAIKRHGFADGDLIPCEWGDLQVQGRDLRLEGRSMRCFFEQTLGTLRAEVEEAWLAGEVVVLNGPLGALLGDKRTFALLSEWGESRFFRADERRLIRTHVPWTRLVASTSTRYRGASVDLPRLISEQRSELVLKPALGTAGEGVLIGRVTTADAWNDTLRQALASGGWIVQEYVETEPLALHDGEHGWALHDLVWGIFTLGQSGGGGFVRAMPRGRPGIINSSLGAMDTVFFEIEDRA